MDEDTARVRVYVPDPNEPNLDLAKALPGLTKLNVVQRGRISAVRVKLNMTGGLRCRTKWSVVHRGRVSAIRVELSFPGGVPGAPAPDTQPGGPVSPAASRSILWVVLERTRKLHKAKSTNAKSYKAGSHKGNRPRRKPRARVSK